MSMKKEMDADQIAKRQYGEEIPNISARVDGLRLKAIRGFRLGADAEAHSSLDIYIKHLMYMMSDPAQLLDPKRFEQIANEVIKAQERLDTVRIADLLEYEFPSSSIAPESMQISELEVTVTPPSPQPYGTEISIDAQAYGGSGDYEYHLIVFEPGMPSYITLQIYGPNNSIIWKSPDRAGTYNLRVWTRCRGGLDRLEALKSFDYKLVTPKDANTHGSRSSTKGI